MSAVEYLVRLRTCRIVLRTGKKKLQPGRCAKAGLRDFRGDIIFEYQRAGWVYHSEVCIWKDPVIEMQRTKAHGLLHKQVCTDASFSRQGLPDYLLVFRKWAEEGQESLVRPVRHERGFEEYFGENHPDGDYTEGDSLYSIHCWQRYASPVWHDINQTRVLNVKAAKSDKDERHICPLQLGVIERSLHLWTNPGDVVFTPFAGIGSEMVVPLEMGRKAVGIELKPEYYRQAIKNIGAVEEKGRQLSLLG